MIKKLDAYIRAVSDSNARFEISNKINELVDAVNNLQTSNAHIQADLHEMRHSSTKDEPDGDDAIQEAERANLYAEQRKWIGRLCRFWNFNKNDGEFNILISLNKESKPLTFVSRYLCEYTHCEPVSPDDDIIYKKD